MDLIIKNENTIARRAWIESAMASVKTHLDASTFSPPPLDALGHEPALQAEAAAVEECSPARPRLYVAWSHGQRRSGT